MRQRRIRFLDGPWEGIRTVPLPLPVDIFVAVGEKLHILGEAEPRIITTGLFFHYRQAEADGCQGGHPYGFTCATELVFACTYPGHPLNLVNQREMESLFEHRKRHPPAWAFSS